MTEQLATITPLVTRYSEAYRMTLGILRHNALLAAGIEPTDAEGYPLYVKAVSEEELRQRLESCFGHSDKFPEVNRALELAHEQVKGE